MMHWKCFKEGMLKACDEVCGKKKGRGDQGDVKEAIARKKDLHKKMCKSGTEVNKVRYKNMKNWAKKVVTKAMKEVAEQEVRGLSEHLNKLVKSLKKDGKDVKGGRCMRGSDGKLSFSEKIMKEENEWDQNVGREEAVKFDIWAPAGIIKNIIPQCVPLVALLNNTNLCMNPTRVGW